jgi:hypothetical protein
MSDIRSHTKTLEIFGNVAALSQENATLGEEFQHSIKMSLLWLEKQMKLPTRLLQLPTRRNLPQASKNKD